MASLPALPNNPQPGSPRVPGDFIANDEALRAAVNNVDNSQLVNGAVTTAKIADAAVTAVKLADAAKLGLSDGTSTRRGKAITSAEQSTVSASYVDLATPDKVQGIVLPSDGIIFVGYVAEWKRSNSINNAYAGLFLNSVPVNIAVGGVNYGTPYLQNVETACLGSTDKYCLLGTSPATGLSSTNDNGSAAPSWPTTGAVIGMGNTGGLAAQTSWVGGATILPIFAAAGTYDVGIKFKTSAGTLTVKNRKLWVWTLAF